MFLAVCRKYVYTGVENIKERKVAMNKRNYQKNIEHHFGMRRSSANSLISSMEQNGYLTRAPVKEDARLKRLVLTEKGQKTSNNIKQRLDDFEASLSALYTTEEQAELLSLLKRLIDQVPDPKCASCSNSTHQERM